MTPRKEKGPKQAPEPATERIQKYISQAGVCSRREAEERIRQGRVTVNGKVATIGQKVDPETDHVLVDGVGIRSRPEKIYLILNKPTGVVTTRRDPHQRKTVLDLIERAGEYLFPVGRLDVDSEGLVLLTNDGTLANTLTHPRHSLEKVYRVLVDRELPEKSQERVRRGMMLEDGRTRPARIKFRERVPRGFWYEIVLQEGRNRQIRRMIGALGAKVRKLVRVRIGPINLGKLPKGKSRELRDEEVRNLRKVK